MARDWFIEIPIVNDRCPSYTEGFLALHLGGFAHLGSAVVPWTERLNSFEFFGFVAERDSHGVLTITAPTKQTFSFRYDPHKDTWYRRVPREAPVGLIATWLAEWRLCRHEYGLFVGTIYYIYRFVTGKIAATYFTVGLFGWTAGILCGVPLDRPRLVLERPALLLHLLASLLIVWAIF
jgi:hypothetical protein